MKSRILDILRVLFVAVILVLSVVVFFNPKKTETNILKAVLTDNQNDRILVDLSKRNSNKINIIFESDDFDNLDNAYKDFFDRLDKNSFYLNETEITGVLDTYKKYPDNFLSDNTRKLLKEKNYDAIVQQSYERLYNPVGLTLLPLEKDAFLLLTDYITGLSAPNSAQDSEIDGKYYKTASFYIKKELALSPTLLNERMTELVALKDSVSDEDVKIYIAGAPSHTYYASSKSMKEINLICVLSSLFIILLCKFYFNSFKILLPIGASLALAMYLGYLVTCMFFDSIHILTFVFASTLIGICVDYCLHYFAHNKDLIRILPSLTQSLLTTVCAFAILLFSNMELLKQISIYTITGLVCVYLVVVLFYPLLCKNIELTKMKTLKFPAIADKIKYTIITVMAIVAISGLFNIKFNDDIKDMYVPPKSLASAEKLYAQLSGSGFNPDFIIVNAKDTQSLLEKEETITQKLFENNIEYYALSRFVPSIKTQKENKSLVKKLYKNSLKSYADPFLSEKTIKDILNTKQEQNFLTPDNTNLSMLKDFLYNDTTSVIVVNTESEKEKVIKQIANKSAATLINLKEDISQKVGSCRKACLILFAPAVIVLFLILAFIYKPKNALKIIFPSFFGAMFSIGLIGLSGKGLNLFHVLALFLIIGFTMDYSIFRFNGSSSSNSKAAVLISCATSVFSFFLLSMTSFKLISSLGFILWVGLLSSYILSVLLISQSSCEQTQRQ